MCIVIQIQSPFMQRVYTWQYYVCFGVFLGKRTFCDAYHKEHASY